MKGRIDEKLVFLGTETRKSKAGNEYKQIKLGNPEKYENHTFFLQDTIDVTGLENGTAVNAVIEIVPRGFMNNVNLVNLYQAK